MLMKVMESHAKVMEIDGYSWVETLRHMYDTYRDAYTDTHAHMHKGIYTVFSDINKHTYTNTTSSWLQYNNRLADTAAENYQTSSNQLQLNAEKTKFIWLGTRQQLAKINFPMITLAGNVI